MFSPELHNRKNNFSKEATKKMKWVPRMWVMSVLTIWKWSKGLQMLIFIHVFIHHSEVYCTELIRQTVQHLLTHTFIWALAANQSTATSTQVGQCHCSIITNTMCLNYKRKRNILACRIYNTNWRILTKVFFPAPSGDGKQILCALGDNSVLLYRSSLSGSPTVYTGAKGTQTRQKLTVAFLISSARVCSTP